MGELDRTMARLDACGAEPELIKLARDCLAPEREDRPAQAGIVAERITAYSVGVQERLRKAELARVEERARRRLTMAVAALALGLIVLGGCGWAWMAGERRQCAERFELAYRETQALHREAEAAGDDPTRWVAAGEAARAAQRLLTDAPDGPTRSSGASFLASVTEAAATAQRDQELLLKLVDVRSAKADDPDGSATDADYGQAFREAGLDARRCLRKTWGQESPRDLRRWPSPWRDSSTIGLKCGGRKGLIQPEPSVSAR